MKRTLLFNLLLLVSTSLFAQVGIGTTSPKAILDVVSPTSGMLIPRYATLAAANTNTLPTLNPKDHNGLMIYVAEAANEGFWFYNGSAFVKVGASTNPPRPSRTRSVLLSAGDFDIPPGSSAGAPTKETLNGIPVLTYAPKSRLMSEVLVPIPADWNGTSPFRLTGYYTSSVAPGNFALGIGQNFFSLNMTVFTSDYCEVVIPAASGTYALMEFTLNCTSPTPSSKVMSLVVSRLGDEAYGDTAAANFSLLGLRIDYQD